MAYAAVMTLLQSLEQLQQPNPCVILHKKEQVESLYGKVNFLRVFLEDSERKRYEHESIKRLEWEIRDMSYRAEDIIDSKLRNISVAKSGKKRKKAYRTLRQSLQQITNEIDAVKEKLERINTDKQNVIRALQAVEFLPGDSSRRVSNMENHVVGLDNDLQRIKDRLTRCLLKLEIIPIVGMGGVGKTTLARSNRYFASLL